MHLTIIVNLLSLPKQLTSCEDIIMLKPKSKFHGTYQEGCIQQAIPSTLLQFVSILEHARSRYQIATEVQAVQRIQNRFSNCSASSMQLLCKVQRRSPTHMLSKDRKTPFPEYIGLSVYTQTRQKGLVEKLNEHGIRIRFGWCQFFSLCRIIRRDSCDYQTALQI